MPEGSKRRLRVAHVIVQPILVYDDGEELTPGPAMNATQVRLSDLSGLADEIRETILQAEASADALG